MKFEIEKFYPGPGIEPGPLALRASTLPLRHPGLYDVKTTVCGDPEVRKNWNKYINSTWDRQLSWMA